MPTGARNPLGKGAKLKPSDPQPRKRAAKGGARPGAGRPKGAFDPAKGRSAAIANAIAEGKRFVEEHDGTPLAADVTPLDVMLMAMRRAYLLGGSLASAPYAEKCAPYIHARIAQIELKNPEGQVFNISFKWSGDDA